MSSSSSFVFCESWFKSDLRAACCGIHVSVENKTNRARVVVVLLLVGRVVPNDFGVFARYHTSTGVFNPKLVRKCVSSWLAWILVTLGRRAAGELNSASAPRAPFPRKHENTEKTLQWGTLHSKKHSIRPHPSIGYIHMYEGTKGDVVQPGHIQKTQEESSIHPLLETRGHQGA